MRFILISDTHLIGRTPIGRLDDTFATSLYKFEYVLSYAKKYNASILIAGDVFDTPRNWFVLLNAMELVVKYKVPIYAVYGQHDTYLYNEGSRAYTCLGAMAESGLVKILGDQPITFSSNIHLYGCHYSPKQTIPVPSLVGSYNILVIHAPIAARALYPGQNFMDAKRFLNTHKEYDLILCGDIHQKFDEKDKLDRHILNTGPMIRKDAGEYNFKHEPNFFYLDVSKSTLLNVLIPHEPAEKVLTRDHIETQAESSEMLNEFIEAVSGNDVEMGVNLVKNIFEFVKANKIEQSIVDIISNTMSKYGVER